MIHHIQGNLLKSDCNIIAHQSNCKMGFGSGIAGQIRVELPAAYKSFMDDDRTPEKKLGNYSYAYQKEVNKHIFNLYGQFDYGREKGKLHTVYDALEEAVCRMLFSLSMTRRFRAGPDVPFKIGMPWKIGCGLAGGDWDGIVYPTLEHRFDEYEMDLWLYEFTP